MSAAGADNMVKLTEDDHAIIAWYSALETAPAEGGVRLTEEDHAAVAWLQAEVTDLGRQAWSGGLAAAFQAEPGPPQPEYFSAESLAQEATGMAAPPVEIGAESLVSAADGEMASTGRTADSAPSETVRDAERLLPAWLYVDEPPPEAEPLPDWLDIAEPAAAAGAESVQPQEVIAEQAPESIEMPQQPIEGAPVTTVASATPGADGHITVAGLPGEPPPDQYPPTSQPGLVAEPEPRAEPAPIAEPPPEYPLASSVAASIPTRPGAAGDRGVLLPDWLFLEETVEGPSLAGPAPIVPPIELPSWLFEPEPAEAGVLSTAPWQDQLAGTPGTQFAADQPPHAEEPLDFDYGGAWSMVRRLRLQLAERERLAAAQAALAAGEDLTKNGARRVKSGELPAPESSDGALELSTAYRIDEAATDEKPVKAGGLFGRLFGKR